MDGPRSELLAVRRALACVSHELNGLLQALFTFLKLAERGAPSSHLGSALAAAGRLRDEVQAVASAAVSGPAVRFDLGTLVEQLGAQVALEPPAVDASVSGDARALAAALRLLVLQVAAGLPAGARVPVALSAGERELRVLVGAQVDGEGVALDALAATWPGKLTLAELLTCVVLEVQGGRLLRSGEPGAWFFELVLPRGGSIQAP